MVAVGRIPSPREFCFSQMREPDGATQENNTVGFCKKTLLLSVPGAPYQSYRDDDLLSSPEKGQQLHTAPARPGLIVVDGALGVISTNTEAVRILTFPDPPGKVQRLDASLAGKIRSMFVEKRPPYRVVEEFRSAKRTYSCRSFPLQIQHTNGSHPKHGSSPSPGWLLVVLERASNESVTIAELSERFGLTLREQETVKYLLEGLTSKEIAQRMEISPNTVKAFIRLVMVKLNVSTRSGIIGKIVGWKAGVGLGNGNGLPQRHSH